MRELNKKRFRESVALYKKNRVAKHIHKLRRR